MGDIVTDQHSCRPDGSFKVSTIGKEGQLLRTVHTVLGGNQLLMRLWLRSEARQEEAAMTPPASLPSLSCSTVEFILGAVLSQSDSRLLKKKMKGGDRCKRDRSIPRIEYVSNERKMQLYYECLQRGNFVQRSRLLIRLIAMGSSLHVREPHMILVSL